MQASESELKDRESEDSINESEEEEDPLEEEPIEEVPIDPEQEFRNKLTSILERLREIPDHAEELKLPEVKTDSKSVYLSICGALKVPLSSTFLWNLESDAMDFSHQSLGENGVLAVTKALVNNTSVRKLDLSFNDLGARCLPAVTSLLNQNEYITHLNLSNNGIGKKKKTGYVGELVSVCYCIKVLNLSANSLGDEELVAIGKSLLELDSVKEVDLSRNDFGPVNAPAFGVCLGKCSELERLDLSDNHMEEGVAAIFASLKNSNLKCLNLARNGIPDDATAPLATGLKNSKALMELDLSGNLITGKGIKPVATGLKGNTCLETLRLSLNPLNPTGATLLLRSVPATLKVLDLSGVKGDILFMKALRKVPEGTEVRYGPNIRFGDRTTRMSPIRETFTPDNVLEELQKLADEKGVSLRHALVGLHATFLAAEEERQNQQEVSSTDQPAAADAPVKVRMVPEKELVRGLVEGPLGVPRALAAEAAVVLCGGEGGEVDLWEVVGRLRWRPDDLAVKIKPIRRPTSKDGGKGKKK